MNKTHHDQALLVAIDAHAGDHVIAALGDRAREEVVDVGASLFDLGFDEDDCPKMPGVYAWDGAITEATTGDYCLVWEGSWRTAMIADFARFGVEGPR